ncbi:C-GCAxxG-C-C family (seleno)protein [Tindallia californiensis]|uniref:C_GCAxxG_C_C family probable redox protein n=1 Tax=Tindallia californiensis TaxID=159292 RepID=A0A1H3PVV9_9FIRM|nr:C-GCAxxG-C-C family (seleno)protein [Tindallia californiensis]SDZ05452.1 C_GCAxxG_C_C family probable redox protein [Tindallia californiensis]
MKTEVSVQQIRKDAEDMFRAGKYYCSEAIVASIKKNFELDMPDEMIAMASGFPVGIGKSKCTCGAVTGGIITLGYFFGRTEGTNPKDPKSVKTLELAYELQDDFKKNHKILCCSVLTKGMDMASGEHKEQCISFTGEVAENAARIIVREKGFVNTDEMDKKEV